MKTYHWSLIYALWAFTDHLDDKEEPVDIDLEHFRLTHRIDKKLEKPQANLFYVNAKNSFEPSFQRELIHIKGEYVILTV